MSSPCQHSGSCQEVMMTIPALNINIDDIGGYQCQCPPPFTGPNCQVRHNPCVWPVAPGNCDLQLGRFFYDRVTQQCLPFNYTGVLLLLFFHIYSVQLQHFETLTLLVHAGLFWCFHNPLNFDMNYRIFNVCMWSFCMRVSPVCMWVYTGNLGL